MVALYKPSKTVKYSPSYRVRLTDRPMRREPQKVCENFALKVFDFFSIVSASDRKNIQDNDRKKFCCTETERKISF